MKQRSQNQRPIVADNTVSTLRYWRQLLKEIMSSVLHFGFRDGMYV